MKAGSLTNSILLKTPSILGSRGGKNKSDDGSEDNITNEIKVAYIDENGKTKHLTHSTIDEATAGPYEIINIAVNYVL